MAETAYGAQVGTPMQSAGVLRAVANRAGLVLQASTATDLVAAVIGADVWARLTREPDLGNAVHHGIEAHEAASRILARAAGYGDEGEGWIADAGRGGDIALAMLDEYRTWAEQELGVSGSRHALWRAGHDLVCGGGQFAEAGVVLQLAAEEG